MTADRDAARSASDSCRCVCPCAGESPLSRCRTPGLHPGCARRHRLLRHLVTWDLLFVGAIFSVGFLPALLRNCAFEIRSVRGPQVALRHVLRFEWCAAIARTELAGAAAGDVTKNAAEGAEAFPAGLEGDVRDGYVGVPKQSLRSFDPTREQVTMRRDAECLLEGAREVRRGDATHPRQSPHRPLLVRGSVHAILGPQQSPQQFGILCHSRTLTDQTGRVVVGTQTSCPTRVGVTDNELGGAPKVTTTTKSHLSCHPLASAFTAESP